MDVEYSKINDDGSLTELTLEMCHALPYDDFEHITAMYTIDPTHSSTSSANMSDHGIATVAVPNEYCDTFGFNHRVADAIHVIKSNEADCILGDTLYKIINTRATTEDAIFIKNTTFKFVAFVYFELDRHMYACAKTMYSDYPEFVHETLFIAPGFSIITCDDTNDLSYWFDDWLLSNKMIRFYYGMDYDEVCIGEIPCNEVGFKFGQALVYNGSLINPFQPIDAQIKEYQEKCAKSTL